jgi:predicted RNA-binding Zn ribbon-like protein
MQKSETAGTGSLELCLDFTDTVDWRTSNHATDKLQTYADLVNWSQRRGVVDEKESRMLLRLSKREEATGERVLEKARVLREAIYRMFSAAAHRERADATDVRVLNGYLAHALAKMEVQITDTGYRLGWCTEEATERVLYPIAKSAADLLTSSDLAKVKECANEEEGCGSLFIDSSKSHSRRWCSMDSCGNKVKLRTYYARHHHPKTWMPAMVS